MAIIFLVGGACEGKKAFADAQYPEAEVISDYHLVVRKQLKDGLDPVMEIEKLFDEISKKAEQGLKEKEIPRNFVLISDEIGCGVIPMDPDERIWREYNGRVNCYIASHADSVIRIIAGMPQKLK